MFDPVLIRGGGEMATGVAAALYRAGYRVVLVESDRPRAIRQTVAFATAIYSGSISIEQITAVHCDAGQIESSWNDGVIPVVIDESAQIRTLQPYKVLVDAIMSKTNAGGTDTTWAPLVIGLGPGFRTGENCHLVVETQRGHNLGRVYDQGSAAPNTGVPGEVGGVSAERIIRSSSTGKLQSCMEIGSRVAKGDTVAHVGEQAIKAVIGGVLRGIMPAGTEVTDQEKIGDIDPRGKPEYCHLISEKARQIGLGVLSAILWHGAGRPGPLPQSNY